MLVYKIQSMKKIAIVIPTYNEVENIFKLTNKILNILPNTNIYVVDDTKDFQIPIKFKDKRINYFLRKNKKGRGSAVLYGLKKALKDKNNELLFEMDADFSHSPDEIIKNIKVFNKKKLDLLIASRYLKKSQIINWSIFRKLFSKLSNFLVNLVLDIGVTDHTNGFRIYSRRSINLIIKKCGKIADGFIILSEILLIIKLNNLKIDEVPTVFLNRKRGKSSVNTKLIVESLIGVVKLYYIKKKFLTLSKAFKKI